MIAFNTKALVLFCYRLPSRSSAAGLRTLQALRIFRMVWCKSGRAASIVDAPLSGDARSQTRSSMAARNLVPVLGVVEMGLAYVCLIHADFCMIL